MSQHRPGSVHPAGLRSRTPLPDLTRYQEGRARLLFESFASHVGDLEHHRILLRNAMKGLVEDFMRRIPKSRLALAPLARRDLDAAFAPPTITALYWYIWCGPPKEAPGPDGVLRKRWKRHHAGPLTPEFLHSLGLSEIALPIFEFDLKRRQLNEAYHRVTAVLCNMRRRLTQRRRDGAGALRAPAPAMPLLRPGLAGLFPPPSLRILDRAWERLLEFAADEYALHLLVERTRRAAPWPGYRIVHLEDRTRPWGKFVWETPGGRLVRRAGKRGQVGRPREVLTDKILRSFGVPERGRKAILALEGERRGLARRHERAVGLFREMERRGRGV